MAGGKRGLPATPDEQKTNGCCPKRRSTVENWRDELIRCDANQREKQREQEKLGSRAAPQRQSLWREFARVWSAIRRHYADPVTDTTLTDNGPDRSLELLGVTLAEEQITGRTN